MIRIPTDYGKNEKLELFKSLSLMQSRPEMESVLKWINTEIRRLDKANRSEQDITTLRQRQGALMTLENILTNVFTADDNYKAVMERANAVR